MANILFDMGMLMAQQVLGSVADASVATSQSAETAKSLCNTRDRVTKALSDMQGYLNSVVDSTVTLQTVRATIDSFSTDAIFLEEDVRLKKRTFLVKLAITVIVGIVGTLFVIFMIFKRSADLKTRLQSIETTISQNAGKYTAS